MITSCSFYHDFMMFMKVILYEWMKIGYNKSNIDIQRM